MDYIFDKESSGGLPLEGLSFGGDSGGPAFIFLNGENYIAGVNSGGACCYYGSKD